MLSASLRQMRQWELTDEELRAEGIGIGAGPVSRSIILPVVMVEMHRRFPQIVFEMVRAHPTDSYEGAGEPSGMIVSSVSKAGFQ